MEFFRIPADPLAEYWTILATAPRAISASLFLAGNWMFSLMATLMNLRPTNSNLAPPFLAGYWLGFASAYVSVLAIMVRYRLRTTGQ